MTDEKRLLALNCCLLAGKLLIQNGSNMDRVNTTIYHIANKAGLHHFEAFTTVTGIVVNSDHLPNATAADIRSRQDNLTKIVTVNDLSRKFAADKIDLPQLYAALQDIERKPMQLSWFSQVLAAAILSLTLMIIFAGDAAESWAAFIIGGFSFWCYLWLMKTIKIKYMGEFLSSVMIAAMAVIFQRFGWVHNVNAIIIGSVMPLVPGMALTNASRDLVGGHLIAGPTRALEAVITAVAIGCGIVIVLRYT